MFTGFAGWIQPTATSRWQPGVLLAMLAALRRAFDPCAPASSRAAVRDGCALGGWVAGPASDTTATDDAAWCVVDGAPGWERSALAGIARCHGHAAAFARGFAELGPGVLRVMSGRFAVTYVEPATRRALLAVDRLAAAPLHYAHTADGALVFASSADAMCAHPAVAAELSAQALIEYFHFQVAYGPGTIYRDVRKLLPAQVAHFEDGRWSVEHYWRMPYDEARSASRTSRRALHHELRTVLRQAVAASVRDASEAGGVGTFLSGGLDSSAILAAASALLPGSVPSFTIRFDAPGHDESGYAALVARRFGSVNHVLTIGAEEMAAFLPRIARGFDAPYGNASAAGVHVAARAARGRGVRVLLAGDGGDELFVGSPLHNLMRAFDVYQRVPAAVRRPLEAALFRLPFTERVPLLRQARKYVRRARVPMPARLRSYEYLAPETFGAVFSPEFLALVDPAGPRHTIERAYGRTDAGSLAQRMQHFALQTTTTDNDLHKVVRMCALAGVEPRLPLLDDAMLDFAARVPPGLLMQPFRLRPLFRDAVRDLLPHEVIRKPKHCFAHPLDFWLSRPTPLRSAVGDSLRAFSRRGILHPELLAGMLRRLEAKTPAAPVDSRLAWYAAVLELWLEHRGLDRWS